MRKLIYSSTLKIFLKLFFRIFYNSKYLSGYYFDVKRMGWWWCWKGLPGRLWGDNRLVPWPVNPRTIVSNGNNVIFDIDNINIFQTPGCYWQTHKAKIIIGKGSYVAPNVGLITTNHDIRNLNKHAEGKDIVIGNSCWIGMNSVILPGVVLGDNTIVGAGSVVTKSFPEGNVIVGGVPAFIIKKIE